MSLTEYDVIVIGGGPAGSAAACTLAGKGISVCLIDKAQFPRDKLCGGLLTLRSKKMFEQVFTADWDSVADYVSQGARFYHKGRLLSSVANYKELTLTKRLLFDNILIGNAQTAGAEVCIGKAVVSIDSERQIVRLNDGQSLSYKCLIGCDGVYSLVARSVFGKGFNKSKTCFALEIEIPRSNLSLCVDAPEIFFGYVNWGYGWIFPKQDTITVGLAGLHGKNRDLKTCFEEFLLERLGFVPNIKFKGYYLPFGVYCKQPGNKNILLCGDAAGLVDPITGEGIAYAMQSGFLAAQAVIKALKYNLPDQAFCFYQKDYHQMSTSIRTANVLKYLIFPAATQWLFIKALPRSRSIAHAYIDLISDDTSYKRFTLLLLKKFSIGLIRKVLQTISKTIK